MGQGRHTLRSVSDPVYPTSELGCATQCSQSAAHSCDVSSSYRSSRLGLSQWDPYAMHRGGCIIVTWWSGAGGIQALSARPTGFFQCFDTVGLVI